MRKYLSILLLVAILFTGLFILTGCEKEETEEKTENIAYSAPEEETENIASSAPEEGIEDQIKVSSEEYFKMVYGEKLLESKIVKIDVCKADSELLKYVDLAEKDYAFEIDYELKPADEKYVPDLTEELGEYDEESGWVKNCHGFGVMRYNEIDDKYDVTSITDIEKYK